MSAFTTIPGTSAPQAYSQPARVCALPTATTTTSNMSVSNSSLSLGEGYPDLDSRHFSHNGGGALTPTSASNCSTPTATTTVLATGVHVGEVEHTFFNTTAEGTPHTLADALPQPQRRVRQWTPRRRSPAGSSLISGRDRGGMEGGGVTTVRDWVQSTRCSPSKQPRSSSVSRRDSFVSSFASALVPRDGDEEERCTMERNSPAMPPNSDERGVAAISAQESDMQRDEADNREEATSLRRGAQDDAAPFAQHRTLSPQRTASWRQLRSHPGGASARMPPPSSSTSSPSLPSIPVAAAAVLSRHGSAVNLWARETEVSTHTQQTVTTAVDSLESGWGRSSPQDTQISAVSSPSVRTPVLSRCASPTARPPAQPGSNTEPIPSGLALSAREREQMQEWQSTAHAMQRDRHNENVYFSESAQLPPTVPVAGARQWGGTAELLSARSDSLSRASATSHSYNTLWSQPAHSSTALTSLGWRDGATENVWSGNSRGGVGGGLSGDGGRDNPFSAVSSRGLSPVSLSLSGGAGGLFPDDVDDSRTMEDIEDANTKRACVESPTLSPTLTSLSFSATSLSEALAAQSSRMALPSEAHVWEQRQRRRRCTSPSVARPDEHDDGEGEQEEVEAVVIRGEQRGGVSSTRSAAQNGSFASETGSLFSQRFASLDNERGGVLANADISGGGANSCSSPFTSAARTSAASSSPSVADCLRAAAPLLGPRYGGQPSPRVEQSCDRGAGGDGGYHDASPSLAPRREATVAPSAALRCGVVELAETNGAAEECVAGRAASLSFCSASEDEPEVDTFALERAQAVMEDADAEAVSELVARQHRLHVHATSDFAQDLRAHGTHVDPLLWDVEEEEEEMNTRQEGTSAVAKVSHTHATAATGFATSPLSPSPPPPLFAMMNNNEESSNGAAGARHGGGTTTPLPDSAMASSHGSPRSPPPIFPASATRAGGADLRAASTATAEPPTSLDGRVSGEEDVFRTPKRPKRPMPHLRWSEPDDSEEGRTPGSTTTTVGSHSLRDVSPPVRERSLAPAELRKEKLPL